MKKIITILAFITTLVIASTALAHTSFTKSSIGMGSTSEAYDDAYKYAYSNAEQDCRFVHKAKGMYGFVAFPIKQWSSGGRYYVKLKVTYECWY